MDDDNQVPPEKLSEQRLLCYKSSLNLLKGRRYNLQIEEGIELGSNTLCLDDISLAKIWEQVEAIQTYVGHLMNIKRAVATLKTNRMHKSCEEACETSDEIKRNVYQISGVFGAILPFHATTQDRQFYDLKLKYSKTLAQYREHVAYKCQKVAKLRENRDAEIQRQIDKSKREVKKINTTRIITMLLIATFVSDHEKYPEINGFRNSMRRDLTLADFKDTWKIGLEDED